jgi:hypothetical protein
MARPGLKPPPRHAVVVRVGDAPVTDEIPMARGSKPPPEPARSEVSGPASDEKVTLRAIPSPSPRPSLVEASAADALAPEPLPPVIESVPPPSDMPVVASIRAPEAPSSRRSPRSASTIVLAAAAGIVLGLGSVALNRWRSIDEAPVGVAGVARPGAELSNAAEPRVVAAPLASSAPAPSSSATPALQAPVPAAPRAPARRSIF